MSWNDQIALLVLIIGSAVFQHVECCRPDYLVFDKQCIKIHPQVTWVTKDSARYTCNWNGEDLLSVSSDDMLKFLSIHTSSYSQMKFWVNFNNSEEDTEGGQSRRYYDARGQPCFVLTNGTIESTNCSVTGGLICSRNITIHHDPTENCAQGLTQHSFVGEDTGNCVYRTSSASTYENANAKCAENRGRFLDLHEIMRDGVAAFHEHKVMMNDGLRYWTDLRLNGTDGLASWIDLKVNGTSEITITGEILTIETHFIPGKGECVTVSFNFASFVKAVLYQTECEDHAYTICAAPYISHPVLPPPQQLQAAASCPQGHNWKMYYNDCFWETSYETSRMSWEDARSHCQAYGGDLSSFHSIDEEKISLSFQYGTHPHPYWIGLRLDLESETYKWSDGSPLDYENWAPGHPDHRDKRLQCVSMDAQSKHWISTLCGMISWFICRVPKRINPPLPVVPTPTPLAICESDSPAPKQFFFEGYCYSLVNNMFNMFNWHRAEENCKNKGSTLVSIHSDKEVGFLLRMMYDDKTARGNRVWIGLNTLRNGVLRWTDFSPLDFTYWNANEPNNLRNNEKCCSMYTGNGLWNDENCNERMGFICKQPKNVTVTHEIPSTPDPTVGNCKKGWYAHHDRCYMPVGYVERERANWTEASAVCEGKGGYLVSIRDGKEQAFLAYLMQGLRNDTWIGLHDTIGSGRYYWLDNSDFQYTNWGLGEPSFFGIEEDCVKMVFDSQNSGIWQDDLCNKKLPFICYTEKDPSIPKPNYNRGLNCIHPPDWLKLGAMCFKMFPGNPATWGEAEVACRREGAHLISISGTQVQAVATYLGTEVNHTFWIGLQFRESTKRFEWLNGHPVALTKWGKNEPSAPPGGPLCYASTPGGYWGRLPCQEQRPFICQITAETVPLRKQYTGNCPNTSVEWKSPEGSHCYLYLNKFKTDWFGANLQCFKYGSYLINIHSLEDLEGVRKQIRPGMRSIFIGLMRNSKDGFSWTNRSPVDFVNWDEGEPNNETRRWQAHCVEMMADTLKWRVATCTAAKDFICSATKDQLIYLLPGQDKFISDSSSGLSTAALTGILIGLLFVVTAIIAAVFLFRPSLGKSAFKNPFRQHSVSYENALYNADSASMEFQNDSL